MGVQKGNPAKFCIDTRKAGSAPVDVQVYNLFIIFVKKYVYLIKYFRLRIINAIM